jgi:hypothetical protein
MQSWLLNKFKSKLKETFFNFDDEFASTFKQKDSFELSMLSGQLELRNLIMQPKKINKKFNDKALPISLKAGMIGLVRINVRRQNC